MCRFVSVDPLAPDYQHYSPYQYAGNKPINSQDIDGLEEEGAKKSPPKEKDQDIPKTIKGWRKFERSEIGFSLGIQGEVEFLGLINLGGSMFNFDIYKRKAFILAGGEKKVESHHIFNNSSFAGANCLIINVL